MAKGLFDLTGKVTLVTGGNGGVGLGFARGIAKQGGDVMIWARSAEKNAKAKAELEAFGVRVETRQLDVSSEQQILDGYRDIKDTFGRVDWVFANSGLLAGPASVLELPTEEYHNLVNVSMHGAFYTLREGARMMVERAEAGEPGGSLVACGSLSIFMGMPGMPHYAGAKAAMGAIIRGMAVEFGRYGIRANVLAPGMIDVDPTGASADNPIVQQMAAHTPIPRTGKPEDLEAVAAYLCCDGAAFHTGDTLVVDGGYLIRPF